MNQREVASTDNLEHLYYYYSATNPFPYLPLLKGGQKGVFPSRSLTTKSAATNQLQSEPVLP
jgi:hypothetical protein